MRRLRRRLENKTSPHRRSERVAAEHHVRGELYLSRGVRRPQQHDANFRILAQQTLDHRRHAIRRSAIECEQTQRRVPGQRQRGDQQYPKQNFHSVSPFIRLM